MKLYQIMGFGDSEKIMEAQENTPTREYYKEMMVDDGFGYITSINQ